MCFFLRPTIFFIIIFLHNLLYLLPLIALNIGLHHLHLQKKKSDQNDNFNYSSFLEVNLVAMNYM